MIFGALSTTGRDEREIQHAQGLQGTAQNWHEEIDLINAQILDADRTSLKDQGDGCGP